MGDILSPEREHLYSDLLSGVWCTATYCFIGPLPRAVCFPTPSSSRAFTKCSNWDVFKDDMVPFNTISCPRCSLCFLMAMHYNIRCSGDSSSTWQNLDSSTSSRPNLTRCFLRRRCPLSKDYSLDLAFFNLALK